MTIEVPADLVQHIERLTRTIAAMTGEKPEDVRRSVEISVLTRGVLAIERGLK